MATGTVVLLEAERASIVATGTGSDTIAVAGIAMTGVIQTVSGMRFVRGLTTALGRAAALNVITTSEDGERSDARQPSADVTDDEKAEQDLVPSAFASPPGEVETKQDRS
jgi:hypothetical protein